MRGGRRIITRKCRIELMLHTNRSRNREGRFRRNGGDGERCGGNMTRMDEMLPMAQDNDDR